MREHHATLLLRTGYDAFPVGQMALNSVSNSYDGTSKKRPGRHARDGLAAQRETLGVGAWRFSSARVLLWYGGCAVSAVDKHVAVGINGSGLVAIWQHRAPIRSWSEWRTLHEFWMIALAGAGLALSIHTISRVDSHVGRL
jgi:hypothetical protein